MISYLRFTESRRKRYFFHDLSCYTENMKVTNVIDGYGGCVNTVQWDKSGTKIVSGGDDTILRVHRYMSEYDKPWLKNSVYEVLLPNSRNILSAKFVPIYNEHIISASKCGTIFLLDINASVDSIKPFYKHTGPVLNLATIPDNPNEFISVSIDKKLCIFDIRSGKKVNELGFPCPLAAVDVHPIVSSQFAVGGGDSFVRIFDRRHLNTDSTMKNVIQVCRPLEFPIDMKSTNSGLFYGYDKRSINSISYEPDFGNFLLVNYMYDNIYLFDLRTQENEEQIVVQENGSERSSSTFHIRNNWNNTGPPRENDNESSDIVCPPSVQSFLNDLQKRRIDDHDKSYCGENSFLSQLTVNKRSKQIRIYYGQQNCRTMIKDTKFWGNKYILSGSECGNILIWCKDNNYPVGAILTDEHVANRVQPHPFLPIIATCGIDYNVKIVESNLFSDTCFQDKVDRLSKIMCENSSRTERARSSQSITVVEFMRIIRAQRMFQRISQRYSNNA